MGVPATSLRCRQRRRTDALRIDSPIAENRRLSASNLPNRSGSDAGGRLEELIDGRLQSAQPDPPLVWSARTPWSGFLLERNVCNDGSAGSILFPCAELIIVVAGSITVKYRARRVDEAFFARKGSVTLWPAGYELSFVSWIADHADGGTQMLRVQLDMSAIEQLAPEHDPTAWLRLEQQCGIEDPTLASLVYLMERDVVAGCPTGQLYGESLSLALAAHVAGRYAATSLDTVLPRNELPRAELTRVLDYISANLAHDLTISELAAVANMSPHYFSLRFKRAVGVTPHQWVLRTRVREAERLLRERSMPVVEVALALGFASQTHFTDVFRRATGTTPRLYQRLC